MEFLTNKGNHFKLGPELHGDILKSWQDEAVTCVIWSRLEKPVCSEVWVCMVEVHKEKKHSQPETGRIISVEMETRQLRNTTGHN